MKKQYLFASLSLYYITAFALAAWLVQPGWFDFLSQKNAADSYIRQAMSKCLDSDAEATCYRELAPDFLDRFTLGEVFEVFEEHEQEPEFFNSCHRTAHYIGQEAYKRIGNIQQIFAEGNYVCLAGVLHGAVEGYFMDKDLMLNDPTAVGAEVRHICGQRSDYNPQQKFVECNHGLGHALMFVADNDVLLALDYCDNLANKNERELCYTGAYMANNDGKDDSDHPSQYYKEEDPVYPCALVKTQQQPQCYTYWVLARFQDDVKKSVETCSNVPEQFRTECFHTFGRDRTMISADPQKIAEECAQAGPSEYQANCTEGAAYNLVIRFGTDSQIPYQLCAVSPDGFKQSCYDNVIRAIKNASSPAAGIVDCEKIQEANYRVQCRENHL